MLRLVLVSYTFVFYLSIFVWGAIPVAIQDICVDDSGGRCCDRSGKLFGIDVSISYLPSPGIAERSSEKNFMWRCLVLG
jgi:hypothetical protein